MRLRRLAPLLPVSFLVLHACKDDPSVAPRSLGTPDGGVIPFVDGGGSVATGGRDAGAVPLPDAGGAPADGGDGGATGPADAGDDAGPADSGADAEAGVSDDGGAGDGGGGECASPAATVAGMTGTSAVALSGSRLVFALAGAGTVHAANLDGSSQTTLITPATDEYFRQITVANGVVFAAGEPANGAAPRIARAPVDGSAAATFYDLEGYAAYETALNLGAFAYVPRAGQMVSDGTTLFVEERTYGGLLAFDATTLTPLGFLLGADADDRSVYGVGRLALQGTRLVALMDRQGIGIPVEIHSIRTFDVTTPSAMTRSKETMRTSSRSSNDLVFDASHSRWLYTSGGGLSAGSIWSFTVAGDGTPSADTQVFSVNTRQLRGLAVSGGVVVVGAPRFEAPAGSNLIQLKNGASSLTPCCTATLSTQSYADAIAASASTAFIGAGSPTTDVQSVALATCP